MFSLIIGSSIAFGILYMIYDIAPTIAQLILAVLLIKIIPSFISLLEEDEEPP